MASSVKYLHQGSFQKPKSKPYETFARKSEKGFSPESSSGSLKGMSRILFEDRNNDWLAKQLREEAAVLKRKDYLDLGASHERSCDARRLRAAHITEHDDSIDNGEI